MHPGGLDTKTQHAEGASIDKLREVTENIVTKLAHGIDATQKNYKISGRQTTMTKNPSIEFTTQKYSSTTQ